MAASLSGQWYSRYTGDDDGWMVINLDRIERHYEGWVNVWSDSGAPGLTSPIKIDRLRVDEPFQVSIMPIHPYTGLPSDWNTVRKLFPESAQQPTPESVEVRTALVSYALDGDTLHIAATTNLGTRIVADAPRTQAGEPTEYEPLSDVTNWAQYKAYVSDLPPRNCIFRGQRELRRLRTAFHRTGRADLVRFLGIDRNELHRHLSSRTKHLFNLNDPDQNGAFLSLVQHHGYPTPLLDWTHSPYIAPFFAYRRISSADARRAGPSKKVRIFIFDQKSWAADFPQFSVLSPRGLHFSLIHFLAVENPRLVPQQSISTITNCDDIETYLRGSELLKGKQYLRIADLPVRERTKVMNDLSVMGITAGSMLPGFDGDCEELRERMFP